MDQPSERGTGTGAATAGARTSNEAEFMNAPPIGIRSSEIVLVYPASEASDVESAFELLKSNQLDVKQVARPMITPGTANKIFYPEGEQEAAQWIRDSLKGMTNLELVSYSPQHQSERQIRVILGAKGQ